MRVLNREALADFSESHADLRKAAGRWLKRIHSTDWESHGHLKSSFPSVSVIDSERVVFNLKGNKYRLLAKLDYEKKRVRIAKAGTHAEYSKWKL